MPPGGGVFCWLGLQQSRGGITTGVWWSVLYRGGGFCLGFVFGFVRIPPGLQKRGYIHNIRIYIYMHVYIYILYIYIYNTYVYIYIYVCVYT